MGKKTPNSTKTGRPAVTLQTPKPAARRQTYFIHDVAKMAGVSISTVSKALNGTGSISQKTRKRIIRICEEIGYTPNPAAKMLRAQRSENIGLFFYPSCIHLFHSPFHGTVVAGAEQVLSKRNYNLLLAGTEFIGDDHRLPKFVKERSVDGVLILGKMPSSLVDELREYGLPFVILDSESADPNVDSVISDNIEGAAAATRFLIEQGHRKIAMFAAKEDDSSTLARFNAFRSTLLERDLFRPDWVLRHAHSEDGGMRAAEELLKMEQRPTALFCVNDSMAIGAMKVFKNVGLQIPRDVSVVGFDDLYVSRFFSPALTTIRVDQMQMGEIGATILLDSLTDESHAPCKRIVQTQLVVRDTVRNIA